MNRLFNSKIFQIFVLMILFGIFLWGIFEQIKLVTVVVGLAIGFGVARFLILPDITDKEGKMWPEHQGLFIFVCLVIGFAMNILGYFHTASLAFVMYGIVLAVWMTKEKKSDSN